MANDNFKELELDDTKYQTLYTKKFLNRKQYVIPDPNKILAFIPGTIRQISVHVGDKINKGDSLLILEAMKMKNDLKSPITGKIKDIYVKPGDIVMKNQVILEFEKQ